MQHERRDAAGTARISLVVTLLLLVVLGVGLIGVSPLALDVFHGSTTHWDRLSSIGQTYGAASAVLSVLAMIGVAMTLVLQARESRAIRLQAIRESHSKLMEMAMESPDLNEVWGPSGLSDPFVLQRQNMYANMILSQWQMSYETRMLTDEHLRLLVTEFLSGTIGREFWVLAREDRLSTSDTRRLRRFHAIVEEEYRRVRDSPAIPPPSPGPRAGNRRWQRSLTLGATAVGLGVAARVIWRIRQRVGERRGG